MLDGILLRDGLLNLEGSEESKQQEASTKEAKIVTVDKVRGSSRTLEHSKVVELALQILFKAWKAWGFTKRGTAGSLQSSG